MTKERLGLFGGSFDPPHLGHLILASEAVHQLKLARLLWVLTPSPPHKTDQTITPVQKRISMLSLAIAGQPGFELSRLELNRPGPQFTFETLQQLARLEPNSDIILLLGGDSLHDLPTWRKPRDLVAACHRLGVMRRPGDEVDLSILEAQLPGISRKVEFIDAPLLEIASSDIRQRIRKGQPYRYYLLPSVFEYIEKTDLYR